MDDAARARTAAREALSDVEPERLHEVLEERLAEAPTTPGGLTLVSARALEPALDADAVAERAAGVQLIYEGLRLTRQLAHAEPWAVGDADVDADLDILAADVFVSRGFYLLARTEAAERAVETVRKFGRDQTRRRSDADPERLDRNLEADVFSLAVVAGATAADVDPSARLLEYAANLARTSDGDLPPARVALSEATADRIAALSSGDRRPAVDDGVNRNA
ncbi:hypothetical protein ACFQJD_14630 [Haloplanus sp. GCM10025708]|uniref:DUF7114 family protein n=1 Tax=Haloferacaceae TaxID=1644056 RepID=UPI0036214222